jgi:predicted Zn-dependent peptidase
MIDEIRVIEMADQVKLHLIKSNKFKTDLIGVYIQRPLTEKEATYNTLLTRILEQGTMSWPTQRQLNDKLDNMYGAILSCDVNKYGEMHAMQFKLQFPSERLIKSEEQLSGGVEIINEVLNKPNLTSENFDRTIFENEVKNLKEEIQSRVNDKMMYALERCTEIMCEEEPFKVHQYGTTKELEKITLEDLVAHYHEILRTAPIDIVVVGSIDFNRVSDLINDRIGISRDRICKIPPSIYKKDIDQVKHVSEHFEVQQAKMTLGLRTNIAFDHPLYNASVLYSNILGGGASSKLFKNVREKASLCYYIFSRVEKYKGIMLISSGIEAEKKEKAMELIQIEMDKMHAGLFDDDDIQISKDALISAIRSISDYPNSFMNFYYSQKLSGKPFDLQGLMKKIELVTKEEIIEAGRMMQLDTIYFLSKEGQGNEEL